MIWIIAYMLSTVLFVGVLYRMGTHAPIGYQDEKGFHYGVKK